MTDITTSQDSPQAQPHRKLHITAYDHLTPQKHHHVRYLVARANRKLKAIDNDWHAYVQSLANGWQGGAE